MEAEEAPTQCKPEQEKLEAELRAKATFSQTHKAATKLYAAELEKGEDGMLSRKVKAVIKKSTKGWSKPCNNSPLCGDERRDRHVTPEKGSNWTYSIVCRICNVFADQSVELHWWS